MVMGKTNNRGFSCRFRVTVARYIRVRKIDRTPISLTRYCLIGSGLERKKVYCNKEIFSSVLAPYTVISMRG
jgi:hypothetical protein